MHAALRNEQQERRSLLRSDEASRRFAREPTDPLRRLIARHAYNTTQQTTGGPPPPPPQTKTPPSRHDLIPFRLLQPGGLLSSSLSMFDGLVHLL